MSEKEKDCHNCETVEKLVKQIESLCRREEQRSTEPGLAYPRLVDLNDGKEFPVMN